MNKENKEITQTKPCAIYVRVSTPMQAEVGLSIESQIETMKQEAARRGKKVFEIYNDAGISGGASNRPEFMRMLKDSQLKPPPFDMILTWSISRFGRNTMESYIATEKLRERGITIFYYKEPFNDDDPVGKMVIQILRAVAEFSRLEYVKDVERSKSHLAKNGLSTGGPPPYGLRRVEVLENGKRHVKWEPDPETAPIAKKIFQMYADGHGFKSICKWLNGQNITTIRGNKWQASSFSRMLRNEIYIGNVVYNKEVKRGMEKNIGSFESKPDDQWIRCDGAVKPIVPRDIFDRVQLILKGNNISLAKAKTSQYLLSGLLKCGVCGNAYFGRTPKKKCGDKVYSYSQYICSKQNRFNEKRDNISINREWFDKLIVDRLFERVLSETNIMERITNEAAEIEQAVKERSRQIEDLKKEKKRVEETQKKYYEAFECGALQPGELKSRLKRHRGRIEEIDLEIVNLQNEISFCTARRDSGLETLLNVDFKRLRNMFDGLPFERQKEFLRAFIEKVVIDPEWFEIHYTLPTGLALDHLLLNPDGDDGGDGNGGEPGSNGRGRRGKNFGTLPREVRIIRKDEREKVRNRNLGGFASHPGTKFVTNITERDATDNCIVACGENEKNETGSCGPPKNRKIKNPQETKPISALANQQPSPHQSSCSFDGEGGHETLAIYAASVDVLIAEGIDHEKYCL